MSSPDRRSGWLVGIVAGVVLGAGAMYGILVWQGRPQGTAPTREQMVHSMGHDVMPFALDRTTHVFEMTDSGGIQDVISKDAADTTQIGLIRQHLSHEAMRFAAGDFSDPMALHGSDMPGVRELSGGGGRIRVTYEDLADGGRLVFATTDLALITAVHRWFGAQLSDHGADATYR